MPSLAATPQDAPPSIDQTFRGMVDDLAAEINRLSAGRNDRIKTPGHNRLIKQMIREVIANSPKDHFADSDNRRVFWDQVDEKISSFGGFTDKERSQWFRAVTDIVSTHRTLIAEAVDGNGEIDDATPPVSKNFKACNVFRLDLKQWSTSQGLESPAFERFQSNVSHCIESLEEIFSRPHNNGDNAKEIESLIWVLLSEFSNLREVEDIGPKRAKIYRFSREMLQTMISNLPIPEEFHSLFTDQASEFPELDDETEEEEEPISEEEQDDNVDNVEPKLKRKRYIERLSGRVKRDRVEKRLAHAVGELENDEKNRVGALLRYNVHGFVNGMTRIIDELVQNKKGGPFAQQLRAYLDRGDTGVYVTTIAEAIIDKLLMTTLRMSRRQSSKSGLFSAMQAETNSFNENCYEGASVLSFSSILGKKAQVLSDTLDEDAASWKIINIEMSKIGADEFEETRERLSFDQGSIDSDFLMGEVERLVVHLEGVDLGKSSEPTPKSDRKPKVSVSRVVAKVEVHEPSSDLTGLKNDYHGVMKSIEGINAELVSLNDGAATLATLQEELGSLHQEQELLTAKMPPFSSDEFRPWSKECEALGGKIGDLETSAEALAEVEREIVMLKGKLFRIKSILEE